MLDFLEFIPYDLFCIRYIRHLVFCIIQIQIFIVGKINVLQTHADKILIL